MPSPRLLLPAAAAAVALAGCSAFDDPGPQTVQARDVASFTRIEAEDEVDVHVRTGVPREMRVRAGEDVIDDVRTEVRDGTLRVWFAGDGFRHGRLLVEVGTGTLEAVETSGAADVVVEGLESEALDVRVSGAGDVAAEGRVERLALDVSGAGDADLRDLAAREARVAVSGSGDAAVNAAERLEVNVSGAGDVDYRGAPRLHERVSGSGDVNHAG